MARYKDQRFSALTLAVTRAIVFAVVLFGAGEPSRPQSAQSEPPAGYRDVRFGPTVYRIPYEKYHVGIQPYDPQRDHAALVFSLILPDLAPSTSDPAEVATWGKGTGFHKELHILVEFGQDYISQEQQFQNAFEDSARMKALQDARAHDGKPMNRFRILTPEDFSSQPNGCKIYQGYMIGGDLMQVCDIGSSLLVTICDTDTATESNRIKSEPGAITGVLGVPIHGTILGALGLPIHVNPYCKVMINYADKTQLTYSFGYEYLEIAPEISKKLTALLDGFRLSPEN
jgi:hypothetical protein